MIAVQDSTPQKSAQAKVENLYFLTHDERIHGYEEKNVIPV